MLLVANGNGMVFQPCGFLVWVVIFWSWKVIFQVTNDATSKIVKEPSELREKPSTSLFDFSIFTKTTESTNQQEQTNIDDLPVSDTIWTAIFDFFIHLTRIYQYSYSGFSKLCWNISSILFSSKELIYADAWTVFLSTIDLCAK